MITTCPVCKKDFVKKLKPQKFCSQKCAKINRYPPRFKVCIHCKKTFQYDSDHKNNIFCSRKCYDNSRNKRVTTFCKLCKKEMINTVARSKERVYCSKKCKYKHLAELRSKMVGKDNPNYIHGNSRSMAYRKKAFDTFTNHCSLCQKKECRLEVHHIDHNPKNDEIENLQILCCSCHIKHHRRYSREIEKAAVVESVAQS